ncbi:flagellin [Cognatishimia sp. WU-CL00825]|uniref:flagellin N-terminal helical domain-containing protein n=1 Tax=Cognatishimia sp. WU-CL00825 TaxID=3127658 RepID=UPI003108A8B9
MSSILTNSSAMVALQTLNMVNKGLNDTQNRVSTGLQISSGKDNAAYFAISENMKSDSGMFKAINEGLTSTKNSVSTARAGAEEVVDLARQFVERVAFAQDESVDHSLVQAELVALADRMTSTIGNATFNGDSMVDGGGTRSIVSGISRDSAGALSVTNMDIDEVDLGAIVTALAALDIDAAADAAAREVILTSANTQLEAATSAATTLGIGEKAVESQQSFLSALTDTLDSGVSAMVDADMEQEAARLQAYQVQQQLATQSLSMANQAPQNILSLFR